MMDLEGGFLVFKRFESVANEQMKKLIFLTNSLFYATTFVFIFVANHKKIDSEIIKITLFATSLVVMSFSF